MRATHPVRGGRRRVSARSADARAFPAIRGMHYRPVTPAEPDRPVDRPERVRMTARIPVAVLVLMVALPAGAQSVADHVSAGDRAHAARDAAAALDHYERALSVDPVNYDALWKASRDAVDLGEFLP